MAHGKADLRAFVRSSFTITLAAILTSLIAPTIAAGDYVDVPSEYYFGRWAQGHYAIADGHLQDSRPPQWRYGYTLTTGEFRFSIDSLASYGLWNSEHGLFETAKLSGWWRPKQNLQVGIANFQYRHTHAEEVLTSNSPRSAFSRYTSVELSPAVKLATDSQLRLDRQQAAYSYQIADFIEAGEAVLTSDAYVYTRRWHSGLFVDYPASSFGSQHSSASEASATTLSLDSRLRLGISPDINLAARLQLVNNTSGSESWRNSMNYDSSKHLAYDEDHSRRSRVYYEFGALMRAYASLFVYGSVSQYFDYHHGEITRTELLNDTLFSTEDSEYRYPLMSQVNRFRLRLDYITTTGFQPAALVDDYQDYYGHLLSAGQWHIGVEGEITRRYWMPSPYGFTMTGRGAVGVADHGEIGLRLTYECRNNTYVDGQMPRVLYTDLQFRFRSYAYVPGQGPGWDRDTRSDIAFGEIPRAGHWLASLTARVLGAYDLCPHGTRFLDFVDLSPHAEFDEYWLHQRLGIGRGIAIESDHYVRLQGDGFKNVHIWWHNYSFGLTVRVAPMVQLRTVLTDEYNYYVNDHPAMWHITLQGLL